MPRLAELRRLFVPRDQDSRLFIADYSAIELRTLAAVCQARFGYSKLGEVITSGIDPHVFTAAAIQGLSLAEFEALEQTDKERFVRGRQAAKAINFGVPGGLGAERLREYAQANYGVTLSLAEAEEFRARHISEVYPELNDQDGYLADNTMAALARNLGLTLAVVWGTLDRRGQRNPLAARGVANVIRGRSKASDGYQGSVWAGLEKLVLAASKSDPGVTKAVLARQGSEELFGRLLRQSVATLTGRLRAGVGFTDSKNTPFQSLAADGAKLAIWRLLYEGFDIYGFVHDEVLVNISASSATMDAQRIQQTMVESMEAVLGGIPADCKYVVSDCWSKP
jgi:DNA polymerase I-like protein with 3'-5' exonuclease and polymerase domains